MSADGTALDLVRPGIAGKVFALGWGDKQFFRWNERAELTGRILIGRRAGAPTFRVDDGDDGDSLNLPLLPHMYLPTAGFGGLNAWGVGDFRPIDGVRISTSSPMGAAIWSFEQEGR